MQQYKSAHVSALTGSVPRKMAKGRQCASAPCQNRTRVARLTAIALTTASEPTFDINPAKKTVHYSSHLATLNRFFACRIVDLRLLKLNIKARHNILEFLTTNLLLIHVIALDIDWSWNIFTLHDFCSMLIEQRINLRKVRTENLRSSYR